MTPPANVPFDEFQEFLKRIQVLRMSNSAVNMNALDNIGETVPTNGSYQSQQRPTADVTHQHHSAPEILRRNESSDNWDGYMESDGVTSTEPSWEYDRNVASTSTFHQQPAMTSIKVTVGIDEDLKMILEMDPSIVDLGGTTVEEPKIIGLPPITGGYGILGFCWMLFSRYDSQQQCYTVFVIVKRKHILNVYLGYLGISMVVSDLH